MRIFNYALIMQSNSTSLTSLELIKTTPGFNACLFGTLLLTFCSAAVAQSATRHASISRCFFVYAPLYEYALKYSDERLRAYALQRLMYVRGHLDSNKGDAEFNSIFQSNLDRNKQAGLLIEKYLVEARNTSNAGMYNAETRKGDACDVELRLTKETPFSSAESARPSVPSEPQTTSNWINPETGISVQLDKAWAVTLGTGETIGTLYREVASIKSTIGYLSISRYGIQPGNLIPDEQEREQVFTANPKLRRIDSPASTYMYKSWAVVFRPSLVSKKGIGGFEILFGSDDSWSVSSSYTLSMDNNSALVSHSCKGAVDLILSTGFPSKDWLNSVLLPRCKAVASRRNQ